MRASVEPISWNGDKWRVMVYTDALGNVFILEEAGMAPIEFDTKEEVDMFIVDYKEKWGIK